MMLSRVAPATQVSDRWTGRVVILRVYPPVYPVCMNEQIGLDWNAASKAADVGIDRADGNAIEEWKSLADDYIFRLAEKSLEFTSEDVWRMGLPANPTGANSALGARFRSAAAEGVICNSGRKKNTLANGKHGSATTIWTSLVCKIHSVDSGRSEIDELRTALALMYGLARMNTEPPSRWAVPGTRGGDVMSVHSRVARLLGLSNPWNHEPDEGVLFSTRVKRLVAKVV